MKIAISGKGGVGKTTVAANLAKLFAQKGFNVIAVDADPDSSLGYALGIPDEVLSEILPIIDKQDLIYEKTGSGAVYSLNPLVDDVAQRFSYTMENGIRFLRMGGVKKGGEACYCRENNFLKALVNSLVLDTGDLVIMDMGAGIEHLTRGTSTGMDLMLIVTEAGKSSVNTARVVEQLAKEIGISNIKFIANKIHGQKDREFIEKNFAKTELLGLVEYEESVAAAGMETGDPHKLSQGFEKVLSQVMPD